MKTVTANGILIVAVLYAATQAMGAQTAEPLRVLDENAHTLVHQYLMERMRSQYETRRETVRESLRSAEAVALRRQWLRDRFREMLGPFPNKTPLRAKVVGTIACDGYRIEKVIYESRPQHRVTANLYVPTTGKPPYPGVLVPCGHSGNGKAAASYQSASILLAKNGMVALCYDPIGQGERHQLPDAPRQGTTIHSLLGIGALAAGVNTGHYRTWDGVRSIDYLAGREEVDATRLGCTGNSGGGTMTTWLMAADDRIAAAAPSCFITSLERIFATIGAQDCEQQYPNMGALGIEHTDFITMRAPKPTIILAAEQDFFDIKGTRDAFREAKAIYEVLGQPDRVDLFTHDDKHGFSTPRRQAAVQWMKRFLLDDPTPVVEPEFELQTDAASQVTRSGQVVEEFDDEVDVATLNLRRAQELAPARKDFWKSNDRQTALAEIQRLIGLSRHRAAPTIRAHGTIDRDGYRIEKLSIRCSERAPIPALLFMPGQSTSKRPATLYVDGRGKAADAQTGGPVEKLVAQGKIVLSIDASCFGETADRGSPGKYYNREYRVAMLAMHGGQSLLGLRVADVLAAMDVLAARDDVDSGRIELVGVGKGGPVALHAAVLDERFTSVVVRDSIRSWIDDVVAKPLARDLIGHVVPSALLKYDLPDLARTLQGKLVVQ